MTNAWSRAPVHPATPLVLEFVDAACPPPRRESSGVTRSTAEIASGGMASVHFARLVGPPGFARTVAIKRAHPHLARDPDFALMFLDEARLASRIRHPNVVPTLDVLQTTDELLLVMDYVHGESLWRLLRAAQRAGRARAARRSPRRIVVDTLHGLHAAHEATDEQGAPLGIVHRDVSPQNILVGVDGVARLVDFGIAKAAGRLHSTRDSSVKGKYAYMAPEQVRGEPVSRLTDTYAAAIVFWELLTGERLFAGKTEAETIHKCLVARVQPPSLFVPSSGAKLDADPEEGALARTGAALPDGARDGARHRVVRARRACRPRSGAWVERIAGALAARERARVDRARWSNARARRRRSAIRRRGDGAGSLAWVDGSALPPWASSAVVTPSHARGTVRSGQPWLAGRRRSARGES